MKVEKRAVCSDDLKVVLMAQRQVDRMVDSKAFQMVELRGQLKVLLMAGEWAAMWAMWMVERKNHKLAHLMVGQWVVRMVGGSDCQKGPCLVAKRACL